MKFLSKLHIAIIVSCLFLVSGVLVPTIASADDDPKGIMDVDLSVKPDPLDETVEGSLDHIFNVLDGSNDQLDMAKLQPMLDFVTTMTTDPKDIEPKKRFNSRGICLRREVKSDLDTILRYFYNPEIPDQLLCPAVLRLSGWYKDSEFLKLKQPLWEELKVLGDSPFIVRGTQFEVNTPDSFAEAYYRYDLKRMIILLKHQGKKVAVSVSLQDEKSDVGRKGAILNDQEWDYFYSGIEGLNRGMIGWMDTFLYGSASVQIFTEHDATTPRSSVFLFKWLRAGWAGMNMVQRSHIYDGSLRYARSFAKVLESSTMTPEELIANMRGVAALSDSEVDAYIQEYARNFEARFKDNPKMEDSDYAEVIEDGGYADVLDKEDRRAIMALERLKGMVGLEPIIDLSNIAVQNPDVGTTGTAVASGDSPES